MKKIILLLLFLGLTTGSVLAGQKTSSLIIKSTGNYLISVAVDELPFSDMAHEVAVRNLKKGKHYVRVMKHRRGFFRSGEELIFEGYITIKKRREVLAEVDSNGNFVIVQDQRVRKNRPYYEVENTFSRKKALSVTIKMDKISIF